MEIHINETVLAGTAGIDIHDLSAVVEETVMSSGITDGQATVFAPGSTAGVTTIEYESGALRDLQDALDRMAPESIPYAHDARWGDGNGYSHVRAALLGPSLTIPLMKSRLTLGAWQQIVLLDFDNRPRQRRVIIQIAGHSGSPAQD